MRIKNFNEHDQKEGATRSAARLHHRLHRTGSLRLIKQKAASPTNPKTSMAEVPPIVRHAAEINQLILRRPAGQRRKVEHLHVEIAVVRRFRRRGVQPQTAQGQLIIKLFVPMG